ncbi:MAG: polysaccharide biosynthesis/export family protein [Bacteroidota bacterium]
MLPQKFDSHCVVRCAAGLLLLLLTGCVSNKRLPYLQDYTQEKPYDVSVNAQHPASIPTYRLQPEDVLSIQISHTTPGTTTSAPVDIPNPNRLQAQHPYLTGYLISDSGYVHLPVVGPVKLIGLTLDEAYLKVVEVANEYYVNPAVRVFMMNFNITVIGEVNAPGRYPVYNNRVSVIEAIGMAGDMGEFANREEVKVVRTQGDSTDIYHLDLTDQLVVRDSRFYLYPNDVVIVKPQKRKRYSGRNIQWILAAGTLVISIVSLTINANRN